MKKYILAIDQGTTSSRAILFDKQCRLVASVSSEFKQIYPKPGWVEHNPEDLISTVVYCMREVVKKAGIEAREIDCIGLTNQRETALVWDKKTGRAIHNAIVWQCRRTADYCERLKEQKLDEFIYAKSGLVTDAYFTATKLKWILDIVEGAKKDAENGKLAFGTVDTFILNRLTKEKILVSDHTNASRTMLYNIHKTDYDNDLLKLFSVPKGILPRVLPSSHFYGFLDKDILGCELPITGVAGDQQAALFGQLCVEKGSIKNTYGTGCFLLMNTGETAVSSRRGLITSLAASLSEKPTYCLEGSVFIGGAVVQWLRDEMKLIQSSAETEELALSVDDNGGVYFVPAFVGLGAPRWDADARGIICGLTRGAGRAHIVRAALESVAYQVFDVMHAMERDTDVKITSLNVDGGASANNFLMQFQSDISSCTVMRPKMREMTALGAAYLAGLNSGFFESIEQLKKISAKNSDRFAPSMPLQQRNSLILGWETAVARARVK